VTRAGITTTTRAGGTALAANPRGVFWLALAVVSALPLFWFGFHGLAREWSRPEFSHGPVIPVLSFYMFLRELKFVPPAEGPVGDRWPGVALILLALLIALAGNVARIDHLVFYALIVWVFGLVLVGFGARRGWLFWPSVLHLVFMLPLPYFLYFKINTGLQLVSSEIGVSFLRSLGVPVFLEGNVIDLGVYKLQVAEACSGLRYMFPIMSFSYVFAVLYRGPVWHKLVILLSAVPIAVLMNSLRIGVIGALVDRYGIAQAEGFLHVFEGWVVFLSCIAILFGLAVLMRRLTGDRTPLGDAIDLDFTGLGAEARRALTVAPSRALAFAALATLALSAAWALTPSRATARMDREPYVLFPMTLGDWTGSPETLDPRVEESLGADDYLSAYYQSPGEAAGVDLFLSYYYSQIDGRSIHAPEICLPGSGWEIAALGPVEVDAGARLGPVTLNRAVIQKGLDRQIVYYWFEGRGRRMHHDFLTRFRTVTDSVTMNRTDGGLVRLVTAILPGEGVAAADARAQAFLREAGDRLHRFIPE
jgi:exosortase D (VPLPA-CTERM-specific)